MIKLQSLRQHLLASIPELKRNPEQLHTFVNDGKIKFARGTNLSHQYTVDAQIIITDYSGSLDTVMIPLLQWLKETLHKYSRGCLSATGRVKYSLPLSDRVSNEADLVCSG
ncbi:phage tail protein [Halomonas titanicae]|uniref:phage tail protein n=1 Tax=Vreelandella titanicae TaxID=664683 RepID=UPI001F325B85|nr:phage tail protein [Halomonas titanicae]MCE7521155.1 phage tail protein [Halomonas titanicae]